MAKRSTINKASRNGNGESAATEQTSYAQPGTNGGAAGGKLTLQQLERHLWRAADILRGKIDSSDYKHYIFGLLFFKRLCDV